MLILGAGYFFVSAVGILHLLAYPGIQFISRCSNVAYYALELCDGSKLQERKVIMGYGNCQLLCLIANGLMQWQQVHI